MRYPMPNEINFSSGFIEIPKYVNVLNLGHFFELVLLTIFFITGSVYFWVKRDLLGAFATASFLTWLLSVYLWVTDLISGWAFGIITALMIIGFASLFIQRDE